MDITATMMASVRDRTFPLAEFSGTAAAEQQMGRQNYAAKIERLDYWLGRYVDLLTSTGELNSTVICLCSGNKVIREQNFQTNLHVHTVRIRKNETPQNRYF